MKEDREVWRPRIPYYYKIGDIVNNLKIIEQGFDVRKDGYKRKSYTIKCLTCGGISSKTEGQINKNSGCGICTGRIVVKGINDVATTHPHLVKFFENPEEAEIVTYSSSKKINCLCPICKKSKKKMYLYNLNRQGYNCPLCGDKISYPEKVISNFLHQLNIEFITQLTKTTFKWCGKYKYDFYLPYFNMIIETHGEQHYKETKNFRVPLKKQQEIDIIKEKLALDNNISHYIVLDCRKSDINWIKQSIINSKIADVFCCDIDNIDWDLINANSLSSDLVKACELWNNDALITTKEIGEIIKHSSSTVYNYLKIGAEIGLCDYTPEEGQARSHSTPLNYNSKPVYFDGNVYLNGSIFAKKFNVSLESVRNWITKKHHPKGKYSIYASIRYATEEEVKSHMINKID